MNMNIFFGIPFLLFGIGFLVLDNNVVASNLITTSGNLTLDFYNIPLANAQEQNEEDDININNNNTINQSDKYVILIFDRGYKSTYTDAKPILDKYGFKTSIFVACERTESPKGMSWDQLRQLQNEGHDIQSHGSEHTNFADIESYEQIESIVREGKECLKDQGFNPAVFQAPYNKGGDDPKIVDIISRYFDFGFTGHSKLMFLNCDGWENFGYDRGSYEGSHDCRPYSDDGSFTPANRYALKEWSHDRGHDKIYENNYLGEDPHGEEVNEAVLKHFSKILESQTKFNKDGNIHAIPIIGYHKIDIGKDYYTSPELFEKEMEYLHENNFKVITLADLGYDENQERFYIKNGDNIGGSEVSQFQNKAQ